MSNASNKHKSPLLKRIALGLGLLLLLAFFVLLYLSMRLTNSGLTFANTLQIPPLLEAVEEDGKKIFELVAQYGETSFFGGATSTTMGFNGGHLGPTIRVDKGDEVVINVSNQLDVPTATHWHGMHVPPEMDGTPHQLIQAGGQWQARYPILNEAATMWYHPHPHGTTALQVSRGLVGLYIVDDENSKSLSIPQEYGVDDIPLVIQDRLFDNDGVLEYSLTNGAYYGDTILVNGTVNPFTSVPAKKIRLRLLNGSNARVYNFGFDDGREFHQIATDGGFLESPVPMTRLRLSSGERAEIVVDLSDGKETLLKSFPEGGVFSRLQLAALQSTRLSHFDIIKLVPEGINETDMVELPQTLNQIDRWAAEEADVIRPMILAGGGAGGGGGRAIPINGKVMDMMRIDEVVMLGDTEIWEISNQGGQPHPFHIHDIQFLILTRDGNPPSAGEAGWKDTVYVEQGETVRVITQFTTYSSPDVPYMYHCHILEHEDRGMMGQFTVIDPNAE